MAWSAGGIFRQTIADGVNNVIVLDLGLETHKVALFDNDITPDFDASAANSAFNAGQWANTNEVSGTGYTGGGSALTGTAISVVAGGIVMWDATDLAWTTATFGPAHGCHIYADALTTPVADQGICGVYFGSGYSVTAGTFTIQWHASGIFRLDVA